MSRGPYRRRDGRSDVEIVRWLDEVGLLPVTQRGHGSGARPRVPYTVRDLAFDALAAQGWSPHLAVAYPRQKWSHVVRELRTERERLDACAATEGRPPLAPYCKGRVCAECGASIDHRALISTRCVPCQQRHTADYHRRVKEIERRRRLGIDP